MKTLQKLTAFLLFTFLLVISVNAGNLNKLNQSAYDKTEQSLLVGLDSDNIGLKASSAYMLGEIKSERAVMPLTRMLRNSADERLRYVAALSLIKIGTERSVYVVKQAKRFNDVESVRKLCRSLYSSYLWEKFDANKEQHNILVTFAN